MWEEKVRVMNQRAFVNVVDSKLHGQQLITEQSRLVVVYKYILNDKALHYI